MSVVAGVDFGTLSVRVSLYDRVHGPVGNASASYPLLRSTSDPDYAAQRHEDQMEALVEAMRMALEGGDTRPEDVKALALDTTGSSVILVDRNLRPLCDYYMWCDHRAAREAAEITLAAQRYDDGRGFAGLEWCGGAYSSEWGWSKLLHWLRRHPEQRDEIATAIENCDMLTAILCGETNLDQISRSICAMGHKWMWNPRWGGLPPEDFLTGVDPLLAGMRAKISGRFQTSAEIAGYLAVHWASKLGLPAGIPLAAGALDAHWDAVGSNIRLGDVVNVIGTSTCIIAVAEREELVPGVCGVVPGSVIPNQVGVEAGLSAVGDIFSAIARRANTEVSLLAEAVSGFHAGQSGLLRMTWDNGDRTVLVNPLLSGVTFGWTLTNTAADEFFSAMEGTAMHTRIILERMEDHGTEVNRVINTGGISKRNEALNQIYANVLNKPVLVPKGDVTSLGSVIFAFLASGDFASVEEAQNVLCHGFTMYRPKPAEAARSEKLFQMFRKVYFALGRDGASAIELGHVLPSLRAIRLAALQEDVC